MTEFVVNARLWVPQSRLRFYMMAIVAEHAQDSFDVAPVPVDASLMLHQIPVDGLS